MNMGKVGDRVGAILDAKNGVVRFLGYGVYAGREVPPEYVGGLNFGIENPRIDLDNGDVVFGCEYWWAGEEEVNKALEEYEVIEKIRIGDIRKKSGSR